MLPLLKFREVAQTALAPCLVFFGTRYRGSFPAIVDRLQKLADDKVIAGFFHAVSRDGGRRGSIQDDMKTNTTQLWDLWQDPKTKVFYCGPKREIPEEMKGIMLELTITEGWLSREEAMAFSGRHEWFIEEV
jgi:sulfite reductase alpha subunit-like flavoprotein